jgi:hypothetical protein
LEREVIGGDECRFWLLRVSEFVLVSNRCHRLMANVTLHGCEIDAERVIYIYTLAFLKSNWNISN